MSQIISIIVPTFRDAERTINLVQDLKLQELPNGIYAEVIVVDDGSNDGSAQLISAALDESVILHQLPHNRGRAIARNEGANLANGEFLLFLDSDCLPAGRQLMLSHLRAATDGTVATIGAVLGDGEGFWSRYQAAASRRRERQYSKGLKFSGSSPNLMVRKQSFLACNGFDSRFRTYGFEDRDLQIRLSEIGDIKWVRNATVRHMDKLSLREVSIKMREAGRQSALLFSETHPKEYVELGYASLDVRKHKSMLPLAFLASCTVLGLARLFDSFIIGLPLPYHAKAAFVKAVTALSYMSGTLSDRQDFEPRK